MAKATEEQRLQLIAKISTGTDRRKWDGVKLQICMEDPTFDDRFAAFINSSELPAAETVALTESLIIQIANLPEPKFPDWSRGRILNGVVEPKMLDLTKLPTEAWLHPDQIGNATRPTGHQILASLVKSYVVGEDEAGKTYQVEPSDAINGHYGLKELLWLEQKWKTLPKSFRDWAKGKLLYGHRDCVRNDSGWLDSPFLYCGVDGPHVCWYDLDFQWSNDGPALREQVGAQG